MPQIQGKVSPNGLRIYNDEKRREPVSVKKIITIRYEMSRNRNCGQMKILCSVH